VINDNQKDKFRRKHIINVIFCKKGCNKSYVILSLNITNSLVESLKPIFIFKSLTTEIYRFVTNIV